MLVFENMMLEFQILSYFLVIEFRNTRKGIFQHENKYVKDVLNKFNMNNDESIAMQLYHQLKLELSMVDMLMKN